MRNTRRNLAMVCSIIALGAVIGDGKVFAQSGGEISLDTITVTANKTEDKVIDTPAGTSVVTREEITRTQPNRLSDVLATVPGVNLQEDGDDPSSVFNIRGVQDFGRVNVMVEGARQNFQRSGHGGNGQVYLEPELIKSVDVTRGPVSTLNGSGAIGGVVNFTLARARDVIREDETWAFSQKVGFDTNRQGFLTSTTMAVQPLEGFGVIGNFIYRDDGDYDDGHGDRIGFTGKEVASGYAKVSWNPYPDLSLDFSWIRQEFDYTTGLSGPDSLRRTDTTDETVVGKLRYRPEDNPLVDFNWSGYNTTTKTNQTRLTGALAGNKRFFNINTTGTDIFNTSRFSTGSLDHTLTIGGDFFEDDVVTNDPGGNGDEFTPTGNRIAYGAFAQNQIDWNDVIRLIVALRYDGYRLESKTAGINTSSDRVSPKVTLAVKPVQGVQVYGIYAEAYRAPSVTETLIQGIHPGGFGFVLKPNQNLKPETARNFEGGVNLSFDGTIKPDDKFRAKVNGYYNKIDDYIGTVFRPCPFFNPVLFPGCLSSPFGDFQYQNLSKVEIYGFEVEALYDFNHGFVQASYTHTIGNDLESDQPLSSIYPHKFVGTLGFRFLEERLTVGGRWTSVEAQKRVPAGEPTSRSHDLFDLFATYDHNRHFSFGVTLKNITDQYYVPFRQSENVPAAGFSALLSATIRTGG